MGEKQRSTPAAGTSRQAFTGAQHTLAYMAWSPATTDRGEDERFASMRAGPINSA